MAEPMHVYTPYQYSRVCEVWERLVKHAGHDVGDIRTHGGVITREQIYAAVLWDVDAPSDVAEDLKLSYSNDYVGSEFDRANARTLAQSYDFVIHEDNNGVWSESYVSLSLGELPVFTTDDAGIDKSIDQLEALTGELDYIAREYPILDESELCDLESEIEEEAWDAYFSSDFASEVADNLGCDIFELEEDFKVSDDQLKEMFYDVHSEMWDVQFRLENATSGYFEEWERVAVVVAENIIKAWKAPVTDPNQLSLA